MLLAIVSPPRIETGTVPAGADARTDAKPDRFAADRGTYERYIRSDGWSRSPARLAELRLSGGRCRICDAGPPERIEVHHRTYVRLGRELVGDLTTLCAPCHLGVTAMLRERRYAEMTVAAPADVREPLGGRRLVASDWLSP